ncbi:MAG: LptF/LptG family permease [Leptospiraceae bacterium]|nr:LptF/LptG family permease [Leptospiraceae bacterium]
MSIFLKLNPFYRLRILDRYLFSEFLRTFFGTLVMLSGILLISVVMDNMKDFNASKEPKIHVYLFLLYSLPRVILMVVPPALMFSVCFVVGQFSANKELVSIMAAGVSFYRTIAPLIFFGILMWFLVFFLNEYLVRKANSLAAYEHSIIKKGVGTKTDLVYQVHIKGKEGFYYIYWYDPGTKSVRGGFNYIRIREKNHPEYIISAQTASYQPEKKNWKLKEIEEIIFTDTLELKAYNKIKEKEYTFPEDAEYFAKPIKKVEEMNFTDLSDEMEVRAGKGMPYADLEVERHSIFAVPIMNLIVVIIGAIAGSFTRKSAGVASLGLTIAVVLLYYIMYSTGRSLGESSAVPPFVAVWTTPFIFLSISFGLYKKFNL